MKSRSLFPEVTPRCSGYLPVAGGHTLYWEECGPAAGLPVLFLHGGPGSGCTPAQRRLFDPERFRAILTDQRGCGRSLPLGETRANTTGELIADLEVLRCARGVSRWIVCGGSWGSALALAYAQAYPASVSGLVLRGIFLGSAEEVAHYLSPQAFPPAWNALAAACGEREILTGYGEMLRSGDAGVREIAARAWLNYERAFMGESPLQGVLDAASVAKVRIQLHYLEHACFLAAGQLLAGIPRIAAIPAALVQGLRDPVCPPVTARALHEAWPRAHWSPVPEGAHGGLSPPIAAATLDALDRVAAQVAFR